jgi:hypothetical protein
MVDPCRAATRGKEGPAEVRKTKMGRLRVKREMRRWRSWANSQGWQTDMAAKVRRTRGQE